jgi:hypothetical protein
MWFIIVYLVLSSSFVIYSNLEEANLKQRLGFWNCVFLIIAILPIILWYIIDGFIVPILKRL